MATRRERDSTRGTQEDLDQRATARGHNLTWETGDNANKPGHAYFTVGTCEDCTGTAIAGPSHSSSYGPIDARNTPCPGGE